MHSCCHVRQQWTAILQHHEAAAHTNSNVVPWTAMQTELYALHDEVVHLLRQSALLGLWFLVMHEPLQLARAAARWNEAAPTEVRHSLLADQAACCTPCFEKLDVALSHARRRKPTARTRKEACMQDDEPVWNERLLELHESWWRVLTVIVILWGMLLVREAVVQGLSKQFHQTRRFDQLTVRTLLPKVTETVGNLRLQGCSVFRDMLLRSLIRL